MKLGTYCRLYLRFAAQCVKTKLEYRVDFALGLSATVLIQLTGIATIWIIFSRIPSIRGWNLYEVALIYGIAAAARGLTEIFFDSVWYLSWFYIREGRLDHLMHRPIDPLFHVIADRVETHGLGNVGMGIGIAGVAWFHLGIPFTPFTVGLLVMTIVSGALIHYAINLFFASISFWLIDMRNILSMIDQFSMLGKYPITIYPKAMQFFITFMLPYAFVAFFPAAVIMGRDDFAALGLAAPLIAIASVAFSTWFFRRGLAAYESTGS